MEYSIIWQASAFRRRACQFTANFQAPGKVTLREFSTGKARPDSVERL